MMRLIRLTFSCLYASALLSFLQAQHPVIDAETNQAQLAPAEITRSEQPERYTERTIYVPYEKIRKVFEKKGRGVFLPYEEFMELWNAARQTSSPPEVKEEPPVDYLIRKVEGTVTIQADVVTVNSTVVIEVFREGWNRIPLSLNDVALSEAAIDNGSARIVSGSDGAHALLVEKPGKEPLQLELKLTFATSYTKSPGRNTVSFRPPQAPISRWEIIVPEPGVDVQIQPLIAATEVPAAADLQQTHVIAFVGATAQVQIAWTPRAEGARGLEALVSADAATQVHVAEGLIRTRTQMTYSVSRAKLAELRLEVPQGYKVVSVDDPNVREWVLTQKSDAQEIVAQLFEPAEKVQHLLVEIEKFELDAVVDVPVVAARNVSRQQGVVVVNLAEGLRAETVIHDGLRQVDIQELPGTLRSSQFKWDFAFRYAALPFDLKLRVEKIQPRIAAEVLLEAHLDPEQLALKMQIFYDVQRVGVFNFQIQIPEDYEIERVDGFSAGDYAAAAVESWQKSESDPALLTVNLARQAKGHIGLLLRLRQTLEEPDLLAPAGRAARIPVGIPRVDPATVAREKGALLVFTTENLRLNVAESAGLRKTAAREAVSSLPPLLQGKERDAALAFVYGQEPISLLLDAERRRPQVTVRQLYIAGIEPGVAKFETRLMYDIRYSAVKKVVVALPAELADQIRVLTPNILRAPENSVAPESEMPENYVALGFTGETEFFGKQEIRLVWEQKIDELSIGQGITLEIPRAIPLGSDRAWGQVVLTKSESIDLKPAADGVAGLRAIDPQHDLMPGVRVPEAARAFEFHDKWSLAVDVRRYQTKDVKATSIERGLVRMVLTRSDTTGVQALYRVRSARQRLTVSLPGEVEFDTQPLRLNGRPVALETGGDGEYYVPLVSQDPDRPFLLELRYVIQNAGRVLRVPHFPQEPATQQVYLSVHYPQEWAHLGATGPWTGEFVWKLQGFNSWPQARKSSEELISWVAEAVDLNRESLKGFPTDGRHVLFSTLRPDTGDGAGLHIFLISRNWLNAWVLLIGVGIGLLLLPAHAPLRLLVCGLVVLAMLVVALFLPSFSRAIITNAIISGAVMVLIIWALQYFLIRKPQERATGRELQDDNPSGGAEHV